jgi:hypothetical protein
MTSVITIYGVTTEVVTTNGNIIFSLLCRQVLSGD